MRDDRLPEARRDMLLRMAIARRIGPYVLAKPESIAEFLVARLIEDLAEIGVQLELTWAPIEPTDA